MESHSRSIAKAISYRLLGSAVTAGIVYLFLNDVRASAGAGAIDLVVKIGLYYLHERIWTVIPLGKSKPPEYEI